MSEKLRLTSHHEEDSLGRIDSVDGIHSHFTGRQDDPERSGYIVPAMSLIEQLEMVEQLANRNDFRNKNWDIQLRPPSDGDPLHYKAGTERPGTRDIMQVALEVTHAELLPHSYRNQQTGEGEEEWHGRYRGTDVYWVREQRHGAVSMQLRSEPKPHELSQAA